MDFLKIKTCGSDKPLGDQIEDMIHDLTARERAYVLLGEIFYNKKDRETDLKIKQMLEALSDYWEGIKYAGIHL